MFSALAPSVSRLAVVASSSLSSSSSRSILTIRAGLHSNNAKIARFVSMTPSLLPARPVATDPSCYSLTAATAMKSSWSVSRCSIGKGRRSLSSSAPSSPESDHNSDGAFSLTDHFHNPQPPTKLTAEMAEGIADMTQFYIRHGVSNQRLIWLSTQTNMPVVEKWQKMMEIFLTTQVHVLAGLGYTGDENGLTKYAQDLIAFLQQENDETIRELFQEVRRDTWRELVAYAFALDSSKDIPVVSIVEARNFMHAVSSKMIHPSILEKIRSLTAAISNPDPEIEIGLKHQVLQHVVVNEVYLGDSPNSIVEKAGFGSGPTAYAKMQCAMSDHEGDPLIAQYAASAMTKIWEAAGLDISSIRGPGLNGGTPLLRDK